ncbi:ABC transporter ATP-binding protein [Paenibacillus caui]|uniref:ABC transporter ATP-binding protein n=1 Tax=Paenibacillus caui TaxID=2873927 RepID=UPI001CA850D9|nr:ABC transporter ATP-binding protein [Paenibacillus caui]
MLEVEQLTKSYKNHTVVNGLTLGIEPNHCVALLGPNGAGKTTTLQMLAGLLKPTSGRIAFMDQLMEQHSIGYLPQYPSFFRWMTAREFLQFAGRLSRMPRSELADKSEEMLHFVGLKDAAGKRIGGFSGGMKQRLGLAQALLHDPKLLILDEPVSALDPSGRLDVLEMMKELKRSRTIVYSTHVLHDAEQVCDDIVMMKEGRALWSGPLDALKESHQDETFILSTSESLEGWIGTRDYVASFSLLSPSNAEIRLAHSDDRNRLLAECIDSGMTIKRFEEKSPSLEDVYREVIGA